MDARLERIGRYAAVARGLEREGAYNAAKLLRAALQRELVRYAEQEGPSGGDGGRRCARGAGVGPRGRACRRAWSRSSVHCRMPSGRATRSRSREAPRVHVCRVCGETFLGDDVPATCPSCEAPALSFHEELPVWYLGPADRGAILGALVGGPRHLARALEGRTDEALARPPAPGEWSARQALEHLLFCEELLAKRIGRLLDEEEPDLAAAAVWADTPASDEGSTADTGEPASVIAARIARAAARDGRAAGEPAGVVLGPRRDPSRVGPGHGALTGGVLRASRGVAPGPAGRRGGGAAARPAGLSGDAASQRTRARQRRSRPSRWGGPASVFASWRTDQARSLALRSSYCCSLMVPASLSAASFASSSAVETWLTAWLAASARASVCTSWAVTLGRMSM